MLFVGVRTHIQARRKDSLQYLGIRFAHLKSKGKLAKFRQALTTSRFQMVSQLSLNLYQVSLKLYRNDQRGLWLLAPKPKRSSQMLKTKLVFS
jgi:hypothetical protein